MLLRPGRIEAIKKLTIILGELPYSAIQLPASRNFYMGILRIPFLCGLRLAKTIPGLRASPGLHIFLLYPFTILPT